MPERHQERPVARSAAAAFAIGAVTAALATSCGARTRPEEGRSIQVVENTGATGGTIATGAMHTCVLVDGSARCWGGSGAGELGDGTTTSSLAPVQVQGLSSGVAAVTAGMNHSCALVRGGVKCWGWNAFGQLGDGTTTS